MAVPLYPCLSVTGCKLPWEEHDLEQGSSLERDGSVQLRPTLKELLAGNSRLPMLPADR